MMNIIGHRGAAGLEKENTLAGIKTAIDNGVDGIEFDIHATKDKNIVLSHDNNLIRTYSIDMNLSTMSIKQIQRLNKNQETSIPTLEEALNVSGNKIVFIEGKGGGWARILAGKIKKYNNPQLCRVISFNHGELFTFGQL